MKRVSLCLIAVVLLSATAAFSVYASASSVPATSNALQIDALLAQASLGTQFCAASSTQQGVFPISRSTILDSVTTNIIICETATCNCFDCVWGVGCEPVPPPDWCQPQ